MVPALALQTLAADEAQAARPNEQRQLFHYQPLEAQSFYETLVGNALDASPQQPLQPAQQQVAMVQPEQQQQQQGQPPVGLQQSPPVAALEQPASRSRSEEPPRPEGAPSGASPEPIASDFMTTSTVASLLVDSSQEAEAGDGPPESGPASERKSAGQAARSPSAFCAGRAPGLYADEAQRCKAYYQCAPTGHQMFRCNNQTQFNQKTQNCDWWYNVDCAGRLGSPNDFEQAPSLASSSFYSAEQAAPLPATEASASAPASAEQHPTTSTLASSTPASAATEAPLPAAPNSTEARRPNELVGFSDRSSTTQDPLLVLLETAASGAAGEQQPRPEVGGAGQEAPTEPSQPRVGAELASEQQPSQEASSARPPAASGEQISTSAPASEELAGEQNKRRLIKSEFGAGVQQQQLEHTGSGKWARAAPQSSAREQQQVLSVGELSLAPANHRSGGQQISAASPNQGSVSYVPAEQSSPPPPPPPPSPVETSQQTKPKESSLATSSSNSDRSDRLERRFGERLGSRSAPGQLTPTTTTTTTTATPTNR